MPYTYNYDLPESVRKHLPEHAQTIYREAFNHAYQEYQDPNKRRYPDDPVEKISHRVAWSAVKKRYRKSDDQNWKEKGQ